MSCDIKASGRLNVKKAHIKVKEYGVSQCTKNAEIKFLKKPKIPRT